MGSVSSSNFVRRRAGVILWMVCLSRLTAGATSPEGLPTLTEAEQIRHLSVEEAAKGYPIRIRGVITDDVPSPDFVIQDATAGIYVEGSVSPRYPHPLGSMVEVEGTSGPGRFAPVIREGSVRVLGVGTLPVSRIYSFGELANGQFDSQWVKVRGTIRSVAIDRTSWPETTLAMNVASGGGQFKVRVPITSEQDFSSYIDSEVLIEGVCGSLFNGERQLIGILFYVPRLRFIKVEARAKEVPFSALLRFSPDQPSTHRVEVRGVVAYQQPGSVLFLQNQGRGVRVLTPQNTPVQVGDVVEALGFPAMGESAPMLEDAVFHKVGHDAAPEPVKFDSAKPWEQFDGALLTTDARLLQRQLQVGGLTLLLQSGDILFEANAPGGDSGNRLASIPLNSDLRLTGICLVRSGGLWPVPQSFRLLLRSPQDVAVIRAPSWFNARHTLWLLGIAVGTLLVVTAWVVVLGRRLREQREISRQKIRMSAVLEERNRIARELHDTLEQELAGITMQLDLAADCFKQAPGVAEHAIESARSMSRHSMVEARRSVWDLRCHLLESGDLVSALKQVVAPLVPRDHAKIDVKITGTPVRLAASMEINLLRIGQEAVANAVKHGRAHGVQIELKFAPAKVSLIVSDDGQGFSPAEAPRTGHFGLLDMRERAQSLGCCLEVESKPGSGTRISVEVPVLAQSPSDAELKANTYSGG